jgi:hypothetical protein
MPSMLALIEVATFQSSTWFRIREFNCPTLFAEPHHFHHSIEIMSMFRLGSANFSTVAAKGSASHSEALARLKKTPLFREAAYIHGKWVNVGCAEANRTQDRVFDFIILACAHFGATHIHFWFSFCTCYFASAPLNFF